MPEPIVLLHGFTQTGEAWEAVRRALPAGCTVHAPDLRGHGSAAAASPVTAAAVFGDLDTVVDGAVLCGYSMGGRLALAYALARPEWVRRLVLIAASPGIADAGERRARRDSDERLARRIERLGLEAFAREWGASELFAGQPAEVAAAAHVQRLRQTPEGLAAALRGLGAAALDPAWDRLGELSTPVTLVVGERDARFRAIAARMADALPRAVMLVVPGAGHAVHLEHPEAVAAALSAHRAEGLS